ncbi:cupin domain-containing protein [Providencia stuartii]|nr:cupin domain-containing protein [Providencia stuartii]
MFIFDKETEAKNIALGTRRKLFPGSENMMIARLSFTAGTLGDLHSHPHEQMSYILKGKFRYQIGDVSKEVGEGDVVYIPSNEKHRCECLSHGEILDIFVPMRKDFLDN